MTPATPATAPGTVVDVDGTPMHAVVQGSGKPVVVIESGLGGGVLEWEAVAADLARDVTVVRRDRPGLGWSAPDDPAAVQPPGERTPAAVARGLRLMLARLELDGPFVLVGHSLGGLYVRAFASLYPDETAGVVLVDPSHEDVPRLSATMRWATRAQVVVSRVLIGCGKPGRNLLRSIQAKALASECAIPMSASTAAVLRQAEELTHRPGVPEAIGAEFAAVMPSYEEIRGLRTSAPFPPVPLRVISQGRPRPSRTMARWQQQWQQLHAGLLELSPDGAHLLAEHSGHLVPLEQPEIIIGAVRDVLGH